MPKTKEIAEKLGYCPGTVVSFKGIIGTIIRHNGGTISKPKVVVKFDDGLILYPNIHQLQIVNSETKKITLLENEPDESLANRRAEKLGYKIGTIVKYKDDPCLDSYVVVKHVGGQLFNPRVVIQTNTETYVVAYCHDLHIIGEKKIDLLVNNDVYAVGNCVKYQNKVMYIGCHLSDRKAILIREDEDEFVNLDECQPYKQYTSTF